jgi:inorganic phosphate transporter, PiT family
MGIITAALVSSGLLHTTAGGKLPVPFWVIICSHLAMGGGTMAGGWRIIKTMGQRITKLTPFGGFSADTAGGMTIVANAIFGIPVGTTHTITGAIVGVGATRRLSAVRWGITRRASSGLGFLPSRAPPCSARPALKRWPTCASKPSPTSPVWLPVWPP